MLKIILRKGLEACVTLFCATLGIFVLTHLAPGDPIQLLLNPSSDVAMSDNGAYEEKAAELRAQLGLDRSLAAQYADWMQRLLSFDLGSSIHTGRLVSAEIAIRLPATIALTATAVLLQILMGLIFGIFSALKAGKFTDGLIRMACVALSSIPGFVIGLFLLSFFAVTMNAYEISSEAGWNRIGLPSVTLALIAAPPFIRVIRSHLLSEFGQLYVLSAISRGLPRKRVVHHALRNMLLPAVTMTALSFTSLIGGAVVIESIFSWPGIGKYALDSILLKDYPVIQGYAFVMVALVVTIHFITDVACALVDPRIRGKGEGMDAA